MYSWENVEEKQQHLDSNQYTKQGILSYEKIFGDNMVSTGGLQTTQKICGRLNLISPFSSSFEDTNSQLEITKKQSPEEDTRLSFEEINRIVQSSEKKILNEQQTFHDQHKNHGQVQQVLDIGCGIGGSAFYMTKTFQCKVIGVDLSKNMIRLGNERLQKQPENVRNKISLNLMDISTAHFENESFDLIYTRDTFIHIPNKLEIFTSCYKWLKPGGMLFISDYINRDGFLSEAYRKYLSNRKYKLTTLSNYAKILEQSGFAEVVAEDQTELLLESCERELGQFLEMRDTFIEDGLSEYWFDYEIRGWKEKIERIKEGSQRWGFLFAHKLKN